MLQNKPVLIVAQTGRALATSAAKAGIAAYVLDRFSDQDTCEIAAGVRTVAGCSSSFNIKQLRSVLSDFIDLPLYGVIAGSGLESDPEVLNWISKHWPLIGNSTEVIKRCKDPLLFFPLLDELGIPHPEIRFDSSIKNDNWLIKQSGGAGGEHISIAGNNGKLSENCYLQKKLDGRNLSVVFIADGKETTIIGLSETYTVDPEHGNYTYSGAVSLHETDINLFDVITDLTCRLVSALQVKGLCGIDFIVDNTGMCYVLEVNPRPTATFELHEHSDSLLQAHIMACRGELIPEYNKIPGYRGHKIIYADTDLSIPDITWPVWTSDRPIPGKIIQSGSPVCTIQAKGEDADSVKALLLFRVRLMQEIIEQYRLAA